MILKDYAFIFKWKECVDKGKEYEQMLMREKLMEYERDKSPQKNWNKRQEEIRAEFKNQTNHTKLVVSKKKLE